MEQKKKTECRSEKQVRCRFDIVSSKFQLLPFSKWFVLYASNYTTKERAMKAYIRLINDAKSSKIGKLSKRKVFYSRQEAMSYFSRKAIRIYVENWTGTFTLEEGDKWLEKYGKKHINEGRLLIYIKTETKNDNTL